MEHSTAVMNQGSDHVTQMNRIAQETIEIASETMENLDRQGDQINQSRNKVSKNDLQQLTFFNCLNKVKRYKFFS